MADGDETPTKSFPSDVVCVALDLLGLTASCVPQPRWADASQPAVGSKEDLAWVGANPKQDLGCVVADAKRDLALVGPQPKQDLPWVGGGLRSCLERVVKVVLHMGWLACGVCYNDGALCKIPFAGHEPPMFGLEVRCFVH